MMNKSNSIYITKIKSENLHQAVTQQTKQKIVSIVTIEMQNVFAVTSRQISCFPTRK